MVVLEIKRKGKRLEMMSFKDNANAKKFASFIKKSSKGTKTNVVSLRKKKRSSKPSFTNTLDRLFG